MVEFGYALICEEHPPEDLVANARAAHDAGFEALAVSDHFHPWLEDQGHSPFAWTLLGALTEAVPLPLVTQVTCPIKRYHPAIVAQMAATTARMAPAGFTLGLGAGESLNEHVVGGDWPDPGTRFEQLEEAVEIIRRLFGGEDLNHRGRWFTVDRARLYTLPDQPAPLALAAGGTQAAELAARLDAGLIVVGPNTEVLEAYREAGGTGPTTAQASVCWDEDADTARKVLRERWRQGALGWDANADIPTPAGFAAATQTVRVEDVTGSKPVGSDLDAYLESMAQFTDAGFDRVVIHNVGDEQGGFLRWAGEELLPALRS